MFHEQAHGTLTQGRVNAGWGRKDAGTLPLRQAPSFSMSKLMTHTPSCTFNRPCGTHTLAAILPLWLALAMLARKASAMIRSLAFHEHHTNWYVPALHFLFSFHLGFRCRRGLNAWTRPSFSATLVSTVQGMELGHRNLKLAPVTEE